MEISLSPLVHTECFCNQSSFLVQFVALYSLNTLCFVTLLLYDTWLWLDVCSGVWFCSSCHLFLPYSSPAKRVWECRIWGNQASAKCTSGTVIGTGRDSLWTDMQWHLSLPPQMEIEHSSMCSSKTERREYVKDTRNKTPKQVRRSSCMQAEGEVNLIYPEENLKV